MDQDTTTSSVIGEEIGFYALIPISLTSRLSVKIRHSLSYRFDPFVPSEAIEEQSDSEEKDPLPPWASPYYGNSRSIGDTIVVSRAPTSQ